MSVAATETPRKEATARDSRKPRRMKKRVTYTILHKNLILQLRLARSIQNNLVHDDHTLRMLESRDGLGCSRVNHAD